MVTVVDMSILAGVVLALVQITKGLLKGVNPGVLPLLSVIFGVVGGVVYFEGDMKIRVLNGIIAGLVASGMFDQVKLKKLIDG